MGMLIFEPDRWMYGLRWRHVKKHYSLMPIFALNILGVSLAIASSIRTSFFDPDAGTDWDNVRDPWERYRFKEHNYVNVYKPWIPCEAPIYKLPGEK